MVLSSPVLRAVALAFVWLEHCFREVEQAERAMGSAERRTRKPTEPRKSQIKPKPKATRSQYTREYKVQVESTTVCVHHGWTTIPLVPCPTTSVFLPLLTPKAPLLALSITLLLVFLSIHSVTLDLNAILATVDAQSSESHIQHALSSDHTSLPPARPTSSR